MLHIYQPWNATEVEATEKAYACRYMASCAYNTWIDAANTAAHAVELWAEAKKSPDFRTAVKKAQAFSASASYIAKEAKKLSGYIPLKDRDPEAEYKKYSKQFHL